MTQQPLLYGWQIRVLIATAAGMALAFALAVLQPTAYIARAYVLVDDHDQSQVALAYARSTEFYASVGRRFEATFAELSRAVEINLNPTGNWILIEVHHQEPIAAAVAANEIAESLIASAPAQSLSMLVSAEPATAPENTVPQGLSLIGGVLALTIALAVEITIARTPVTGVVRTAADASALTGGPAVALPHRLALGTESIDPAAALELVRVLAPADEPPRILVIASSRPDAFALGELVQHVLGAAAPPRANSAIRAIEAENSLAASMPFDEATGGVLILQTMNSAEIQHWLSGSNRVVIGARAGEASALALRDAARTVRAEGHEVNAVVVDAPRRQRRNVAETHAEIMD